MLINAVQGAAALTFSFVHWAIASASLSFKPFFSFVSSIQSAVEPSVEPSVLSGGAFDGSSGLGASESRVRHLLLGTLRGVKREIAHLHALGYADPNDWSRPISTGRPNEVMAILTRRVQA